MSKPKKNSTIQKAKIKQLKMRLRKALKSIHDLKRRNRRLLQHIKPSLRTFKYRPRIVKVIELQTFHRFPNRTFEIRLKSLPPSLTIKPTEPKTLHCISKTPFQIRHKSRPRPQIVKPPELTAFHYFPYLPYEVRVPIWKLAVNAAPGRDILLRVDPLEYRKEDSRKWAEMSSSTTIPAFLHTCQLSRALAGERWVLCMAAYEDCEAKVYVDVGSDSICFPSLTLMWHWQANEAREEVRRIASACKVYVMSDGTVRGLKYVEVYSDYPLTIFGGVVPAYDED